MNNFPDPKSWKQNDEIKPIWTKPSDLFPAFHSANKTETSQLLEKKQKKTIRIGKYEFEFSAKMLEH